MDPTTRDIQATPAEPPQPRAPRAARWLVGGVVGVAVLLLAVPVALTASPRQCASCHEMKPYYDTWNVSTHRAAAPNCRYCHAEPGVLGFLGYEAGFYGMFAKHLAGAQVTTTAANAPAVASCRRPECHSLNRETSNAGDIKIDHRLHVTKANIPCTRCHPGAVHAGVNGRQKLPPMSLCKQCHADKMQQCSYCHTQQQLQPAPPGAHG